MDTRVRPCVHRLGRTNERVRSLARTHERPDARVHPCVHWLGRTYERVCSCVHRLGRTRAFIVWDKRVRPFVHLLGRMDARMRSRVHWLGRTCAPVAWDEGVRPCVHWLGRMGARASIGQEAQTHACAYVRPLARTPGSTRVPACARTFIGWGARTHARVSVG